MWGWVVCVCVWVGGGGVGGGGGGGARAHWTPPHSILLNPSHHSPVTAGSRLVAVFMSSLLNPLTLLPLVPHLLVLTYIIAVLRSNPTLCAAPLLTHPLMRQRIHAFHATMQLLGTALPGMQHPHVSASVMVVTDHSHSVACSAPAAFKPRYDAACRWSGAVAAVYAGLGKPAG